YHVAKASITPGTAKVASRSGLTEMSPVKGRLYAAIIKEDSAMPVANIATVSRLSLWTNAIAISAQSPCSRIAAHLTGAHSQLTDDDALTPCVKRSLQRSHHLALRRALSVILSVPRNRELQGFNQALGKVPSVRRSCAIAGHSRLTASSICRLMRLR